MNPTRIQNVYMLRPKYDEYEIMTFRNVATDYSLLYQFKGQPIDDWNTPEVVFERKKGRKVADFPVFSVHIPVFSKKAITCLEDFLLDYGQILPLKSKQGDYYAYNVTTVIDAMDKTSSEITYFPDGRFMDVAKYVFKKVKVEKLVIFKQKKAELMDVFVNEDFVETIVQNDLSGFDFYKINLI